MLIASFQKGGFIVDIELFLKEHPELLLESEKAVNLDDNLTIACKCHCGSRSSEIH
nr:MAG TPA: copper resistance protein [Caudoviricetes sp.]